MVEPHLTDRIENSYTLVTQIHNILQGAWHIRNMQRFQKKKQPSVFKENSEITNQTQGFHISFEFITAHLAVLFVKWGGCFINVALLCRLLVLDARTPSQTQLTTENVIKKIQSVSKSFGKKGNHGQIVGLELANHGLVAGC